MQQIAVDLSDQALARVSAELAETAEQFDRSAEFPWSGIAAVHRAGLLTAGIGAAYGEAQLVQAEEVIHGLAVRVDAGDQQATERVFLAKLLATRSAVSAVQTAVAAIGNPGLTRHNPLERQLRDVLCSRVHPPQDDAALVTAGRRVLNAAQSVGQSVGQAEQKRGAAL